jgi:GH24 family phage-related lysozyme (muramidase)
VGVTNASGHQVHPRYLRNPQTLTRCLEVYEWLVRTKYLPEVRAAFGRIQLNEHQLAAALSFHWNTGAIARASWVRSFRDGNIAQARREFMNWSKPKEIIGRREAERDLHGLRRGLAADQAVGVFGALLVVVEQVGVADGHLRRQFKVAGHGQRQRLCGWRVLRGCQVNEWNGVDGFFSTRAEIELVAQAALEKVRSS